MDIFPTYNQVGNNKMNPKVFIIQLNSYEHFTKKEIFLIIEGTVSESGKNDRISVFKARGSVF